MRRSGPLPSLLLAVLLTASAGFPGLEPLASEHPIQLMAMTELTAGDNGHFTTQAEINNREVRVLVDTGATAVALSYEDAEHVGLRPASLKYDIKIQTANGIAKGAHVILKEVEIDGVRVRDVKGMVLQEGALNGTLLGMSYLSRLRGFSVENGKLILKN